MLGSRLQLDGSGALAERGVGFAAFPQDAQQESFHTIKMPTSNTKPDAPTDVILRNDVVTGQTTPHRVLTPSTIERAELMSQYTYSTDSLRLSNTPSSERENTESY